MKPGDLQNGPSIRILRALKQGPNDTLTLAKELGLTRKQAKCALQFLAAGDRVVRMGTIRHPGLLGRAPVLFALKNFDSLQEQMRKAEALLSGAGYTILPPGRALTRTL